AIRKVQLGKMECKSPSIRAGGYKTSGRETWRQTSKTGYRQWLIESKQMDSLHENYTKRKHGILFLFLMYQNLLIMIQQAEWRTGAFFHNPRQYQRHSLAEILIFILIIYWIAGTVTNSFVIVFIETLQFWMQPLKLADRT
ncbi:MAG TPA: hypothetical protein VK616_20355, partial [Flavitalea sp.]|nr:hypothetical protein [Flavitalea sp.]